MAVRAIRGATQLDVDEREHLLERSAELVKAVLEANDLENEDLISILFTVTDDLRSAFPAEAARQMGLGDIPLLCAREIPVEGAMPSVVRVLMHFHTDLALRDVTHVYLDGAERLRDDLDAAT